MFQVGNAADFAPFVCSEQVIVIGIESSDHGNSFPSLLGVVVCLSMYLAVLLA